MKLLHGFERPALYRGGYVSIGNFDGVHRGHQAMIGALVRLASAQGVPAVVLTFDPHPIVILRPEHAPPSLSVMDRKAELLEKCRVDCTIAYPTDRALLNLTPRQFFERIVQGELQARGLVEGPNFFFGHDRAGDVNTLRSLCDQSGLSLEVVAPVEIDGRVVSSSVVRSLIADGKIREAVTLLGHPYRLRGRVVPGAGRGRILGVPTANLDDVQTLLPPDGVYAAKAHAEGHAYPAAVNLGPNPTFDEDRRKLEVHLIGFEGRLYDQLLDVDLLAEIRGTKRFQSSADLQQQLQQDMAQVRSIAEDHLARE